MKYYKNIDTNDSSFAIYKGPATIHTKFESSDRFKFKYIGCCKYSRKEVWNKNIISPNEILGPFASYVIQEISREEAFLEVL